MTVVGDRCNEGNHVPPLRTVHLDSWSLVGAEAHFRRLHLTELPLKGAESAPSSGISGSVTNVITIVRYLNSVLAALAGPHKRQQAARFPVWITCCQGSPPKRTSFVTQVDCMGPGEERQQPAHRPAGHRSVERTAQGDQAMGALPSGGPQ
eukprot:4482577-Pyramimonas_sp.AAC.1